MATMFEHFEPRNTPSSMEMASGFPIAPAMQAIIVDCVSVVDPQLAAIIGDNPKPVIASFEDSHAACPTHSKMIATRKTRPSATCVFIVHHLTPACHVRFATTKVLAPTALPKIKGLLSENSAAIRGWRCTTAATCTQNKPTAPSVETFVPEQHPSITTTLEHFKSHMMPARAQMPIGFPIAPAMQAIVVDRVPIVNPQLAAVIRDDAEAVMASPVNSHTPCPTHSEMVTS
jgi:hypothetical protein